MTRTMTATVTRAYKFRLYPTARQHVLLASMLAAHCELYNAALQERRDAYRTRGISVSATEQSAQLTTIRRVRPDQAMWSFTSQQQTLRRLNKAFQSFFRRVKTGEAPGYPRFRSTSRFDSVDFRQGDGIKFDSTVRLRHSGRRTEARVRVQGIGTIRVNLHRNLPDSLIGQVTIKREGVGNRTRWFVVLPLTVDAVELPPTGAIVGLDMATGDNGLAYTSDGQCIDNPQFLKRNAAKLANAQRELSAKKRGSTRRKHAVAKVARLHGKVRRSRLDHHYKVTTKLIAEHDLIAVEGLKIANMTRRAKPMPDPDNTGQYLPNGAAAKTGLNKSITDSGWGIFLNLLTAKAESAGRNVIVVNPRNTSRTCYACGHIDVGNRNGKHFTCLTCGHHDDADINAAKNILRAGLALHESAHGCLMRRSRPLQGWRNHERIDMTKQSLVVLSEFT